MKLVSRFVITLCIFGASLQVSAQDISASLEASLNQKLTTMGLALQRLERAPELEGFYLAFTNQGVFYIAEDGSQLIAGKVYAIAGQPVDLTEQTVGRVRRSLLEELDGKTLEYPAADEQFEVTIFTDHTCPYCRQLHEQMDAYNELGISVRYMAFPRAGLEARSASELQSIWCAENPEQAMDSAMGGTTPPSEECEASMVEHLTYARQMGVTGTPGIILPTGRLIPGFVPPEALIQELRGGR
ncbi:MAG: thiol:disulfide interchange protein Dsb [Idiomarinaceae bacterium HL-53]|nr:MAG: thiol:disulfide interchange protein Dsb [Idiomarinaceae bacterium HL-53]CUS49257.1 thiol:disulfide interchange protein DsbC [Idiomarinaceae bacterium HL-53]